jgi:cobalt/nickel transport system ATP-binding protein
MVTMKKKIVEIKDLSYNYPDGKAALRDISLDIYEGETVGIVGGNGAGKTTLLLHLNGILQSSTAHVRILGKEVNKANLSDIRSRVGFVFQNPDDQLFSPTVFEDVAFGPVNFGFPQAEVDKRVAEALERIGMKGFENRVPHHLSSGEKKKISIATVLSLPCELLVLDEPTSNLDPRSRRNLIELLTGLAPAKIIAGHDMELVVRLCNRVVVLNDGGIAADGTPEEVFASQEFVEQQAIY